METPSSDEPLLAPSGLTEWLCNNPLADEWEETEAKACADYLYCRRHWARSVEPGLGPLPMPWDGYNQRLCKRLAAPWMKHFAVDKCRQMMVTWETAFYLLHLLMFTPNIEIGVKGKEEGQGGYILRDRIMPMWEALPGFLKRRHPVWINEARAELRSGNGSQAKALAEGARSVHGWQFHTLLLDECSRMRYFGQIALEGAQANKGRVRLIMTSTPNGEGDWFRMVKPMAAA
jgi:hypothetical protein